MTLVSLAQQRHRIAKQTAGVTLLAGVVMFGCFGATYRAGGKPNGKRDRAVHSPTVEPSRHCVQLRVIGGWPPSPRTLAAQTGAGILHANARPPLRPAS